MAGRATCSMSRSGLQGVIRNFCCPTKLATVAALIATREVNQESLINTSDLESSVRSYGQNWDFRENIWKSSEALELWLLEEEPAQVAADLLGTDQVWLLRDQTYFKRPGSERTAWHQDAMFMPVRGCNFLTLWIPFSAINHASDSPLEYWSPTVPACHLLEGGSAESSFMSYRSYWQHQGWAHTSTLGLQPGDCSFHDGWTLHGSDVHYAKHDRLAFVAVYGCGEGQLELAPPMPHAPDSLRDQVHLLRKGLHQSCFEELMEGDPVSSHHNPMIRCSPKQSLPIHSPKSLSD